MLNKYFFAPAVLTILLTGCATSTAPVPDRPPKPLPDGFYSQVNASWIADAIAAECRRIKYDRRYENAVVDQIAVQLIEQGYTEYDLDYAYEDYSDADAQDMFLGWVDHRSIVFADPETYCAAGDAEIAENTAVGKYLNHR